MGKIETVSDAEEHIQNAINLAGPHSGEVCSLVLEIVELGFGCEDRSLLVKEFALGELYGLS